ncbi:hypothetical protein [Gordonia sp. QH-12]|uniref:VG15 protein n=1 Tax=Gordonia sp. QH-12 TaxID=1437876 RepID=UPI0012E95E83|nr:hypothetical protein [Gordonia sp. QH-12]
MTPYVAAAADLGTVWYDETPTTTNYRAVPAEPIPVERLTQSALWALNVGTAETGLDLLTGSATRAMYDGMRETVVENVTRERGARWYRHASATACGWCRMIATRHVGDGATFYRSAKAAGDGNRYHDHCHCMAVMIRPGQTPELPSYIEQWNDDYLAARKAGATDPKDIAKAMDNAPTGKTTVTREAREAAKAEKEAAKLRGSAAGGGRPPKDPGASRSTGFGDPEEPEWSGHTKGYVHPHQQPIWTETERQARQSSLGIKLNGEQLYQHEIETVERAQRNGWNIQEWIPRRVDPKSGRRLPSNDFPVDVDGVTIEVDTKATRAKYATIKKHLADSVKQAKIARSYGLDLQKDYFLVDLGKQPLNEKLRNQLATYNRRNPHNRVKGLWVLSEDGGSFTRIDLLT